MVSNPTGLCSASTTSQSHPTWAMLSAAIGEQSVSHVPTAGWPLRSLSVTGLVLILVLLKVLMTLLLLCDDTNCFPGGIYIRNAPHDRPTISSCANTTRRGGSPIRHTPIGRVI